MAERNPPSWLEAGSHPSQNDRLILADIFDGEGVLDVNSGALAVTEKSGTPNMSVDVAAGSGVIQGDDVAYQGVYHVVNDATVNVAIASSDSTNDRIDLIVAQVRDSEYAGGADEWEIVAVTGVAAATPVAPDVPDDAMALAEIAVGAGVTSITDADITDLRAGTRLRATGNLMIMRERDPSVAANYTPPNSASFSEVSTYWRFSIAATEGDVLMFGISGVWGNEAVDAHMDVATIVGGAIQNTFTGGDTQGLRGWNGSSGVFMPLSGEVPYTVAAADIVSGEVTVSPIYRRVSATSKTFFSQSGVDLRMWVRNIGPAIT